MITERVIEFLRQLLKRHDDMSIDLKSILAKLDTQGKTIADQGTKIDQLIATRDAQEQADLQQIDTLLDANAAASAANAAKLVGALTPESSDAASTTVTVSSTGTTAPAHVIPVDSTAGVTVGGTVTGTGVDTTAPVTVTFVDPVASTITLSAPTVDDHAGGETLTVTPAS